MRTVDVASGKGLCRGLLDLGSIYPLQDLVVRAEGPGQAAAPRIETSLNGEAWTPLQAPAGDDGALKIPLGGTLCARFVRLSRDGDEDSPAATVQVFVDACDLYLQAFAARIGAEPEKTFPLDGTISKYRKKIKFFKIEGNTDGFFGEITAIRVVKAGRLGNNFLQIINAIFFALTFGIKRVVLPRTPTQRFSVPRVVGGIAFLPEESGVESDEIRLAGTFSHKDGIGRCLRKLSSGDYGRIIEDYIKVLMLEIPAGGSRSRDRELTVHFRGGDIFNVRNRKNIHAGYAQPPLSYYTKIFDDLYGAGAIERVRLVSEDRENPCVAHLEAYLRALSVPFEFQSSDLLSDVSALANAAYVVFGFGTFGVVPCALSATVGHLWAFRMKVYQHIPSVRNFTLVDADADYIQSGQWEASPEQLDLMLRYPREKLTFTQVRQAREA